MSAPAWTPGAVVPIHSRFRWAPTGPLHIGHAWVAWLNQQAALVTGGTFSCRIEQLKTCSSVSRRSGYHQYAQANYEDLRAFGIRSSDTTSFLRHDMDPAWAWQPIDDRSLIDYYWRLIGFESIWGKWPPPVGPKPEEIDNHWRSAIFGWYDQGHMHPYLLFAQTVGDVVTMRNCIIRGNDLAPESHMVNAFAQALAKERYHLDDWETTPKYVAAQYYVAPLLRSGTRLPPELQQRGGVRLSSSMPAVTAGFYLKDVLGAGISLDAVFSLICRSYLGDGNLARLRDELGQVRVRSWDDRHTTEVIAQSGVRRMTERMNHPAVIDDDEWFSLIGRSIQ